MDIARILVPAFPFCFDANGDMVKANIFCRRGVDARGTLSRKRWLAAELSNNAFLDGGGSLEDEGEVDGF